MSRDFKQLLVWQMGVQLTLHVYEVTRKFPKEETYGLTSQLKRCAVSIPSNIAEGHGRKTEKDFLKFLVQARGSLMEFQTQIHIAKELGFMDSAAFKRLQSESEILAMSLNKLMDSIRKQIGNG